MKATPLRWQRIMLTALLICAALAGFFACPTLARHWREIHDTPAAATAQQQVAITSVALGMHLDGNDGSDPARSEVLQARTGWPPCAYRPTTHRPDDIPCLPMDHWLISDLISAASLKMKHSLIRVNRTPIARHPDPSFQGLALIGSIPDQGPDIDSSQACWNRAAGKRLPHAMALLTVSRAIVSHDGWTRAPPPF